MPTSPLSPSQSRGHAGSLPTGSSHNSNDLLGFSISMGGHRMTLLQILPWVLAVGGLLYGALGNSPDVFRAVGNSGISNSGGNSMGAYTGGFSTGNSIRGGRDNFGVDTEQKQEQQLGAEEEEEEEEEGQGESQRLTQRSNGPPAKRVKTIVIEEYEDDDEEEYDDDDDTTEETATGSQEGGGEGTTTSLPPPPPPAAPSSSSSAATKKMFGPTTDDIPQVAASKPVLNCKACFRYGMRMGLRKCFPSECPVFPPSNRNVVSTSLYGDALRYTGGAIRNSEIASIVFPGWQLRFYVKPEGAPAAILDEMRTLGVDIVTITDNDVGFGMNWRFLVADDTSVDAFICRDADSRLSLRDRYAVDDWLKGGKPFHVVRDHPSHASLQVMGGTWGARRNIFDSIGSLKSLLAAYISRTKDGEGYMADINFLQTDVWPRMITNGLSQHDSYSCPAGRHGNEPGSPFPRPRAGVEHVGAVYLFDNGGREQPRQGDLDILIQQRPPPECQPTSTVLGEARQEWGLTELLNTAAKVTMWDQFRAHCLLTGNVFCSLDWRQTQGFCKSRGNTLSSSSCLPTLIRWQDAWVDHLKENGGRPYTAIFDYDHHVLVGGPPGRALNSKDGITIPQYHERMPYEQEPIQALDGGVRYYTSLLVPSAAYGEGRVLPTDVKAVTEFALQDLPRLMQIVNPETVILMPPALASAVDGVLLAAKTNGQLNAEVAEELRGHVIGQEESPNLYYARHVFYATCGC